MKTNRRSPKPSPTGASLQRINRVLASSGLGSRRHCEELITAGRVEIDGEICTNLATKVDPSTSKIFVDGEPLRRSRPTYIAVNKPAGVLCTNRDPQGRTRVVDLVPGTHRLFPVGRLDRSSTGLILLTNDGELAQQLTHPRYGVPKTYFVVVQGQVGKEQLDRMRRGVRLAEGVARVEDVRVRRTRQGCTEMEMTLTEGKNREIRRVLARLGHKVMILRRLAVGPLRLANLQEGEFRTLAAAEVDALYRAVEQSRRQQKQKRIEKKGKAKPPASPSTLKAAPEPTEEDFDAEAGALLGDVERIEVSPFGDDDEVFHYEADGEVLEYEENREWKHPKQSVSDSGSKKPRRQVPPRKGTSGQQDRSGKPKGKNFVGRSTSRNASSKKSGGSGKTREAKPHSQGRLTKPSAPKHRGRVSGKPRGRR